MSDSEKLDDIFIIPDEEKALRAKRKEQLRLRKEKNKELRAKIARSKAIEKSEQKKTIKKNKSDIDDLKEQLRKIRESNGVEENKLSNNLDNDKQDDILIHNIEKNDIQEKENKISKNIKKVDIKNKENNIEKKVEFVEQKKEPPKRVINPILFKRRF